MAQPNFVVIYCDDLGYGDLGCYGSNYVKTPNLDQLAGDGVRFTNWYSNSPVCSPSRASLLTGLYPAKTGVTQIIGGKRGTSGLSEDVTTIAAALKSRGYSTGLFGKWHLGVTPTAPSTFGFDEFFGFLAGCVDYYSHIFYWGQGQGIAPVHDLWENGVEVWQNGQYLTEVITEKAARFIQDQKGKDQPFFMYVPYNAPHYPMHAPKEYMDRFAHLPWKHQVMAAMIAAVDDGVGEIVRTLKSIGQYENTVIFFSSDNGPSVEQRNWLDGTETRYDGGNAGIFRGHKGSLFEGGIREPAILSYPSLFAGGQVCDEIGIMMDILPTFLSLVDKAPVNIECDGKSLLYMLTEGSESPHDQLFWEYNHQLAIRQGKWKLVQNGKLDFDREAEESVHLANLEEDPGEKNNLADSYPNLVEQMKADVTNWYAGL